MHLMKRTCSAMSPLASHRTCPLQIMCYFVAFDNSFCSAQGTEAKAYIDPRFDRTVILLDNIVEIRDHAAANRWPSTRFFLSFSITLETMGSRLH